MSDLTLLGKVQDLLLLQAKLRSRLEYPGCIVIECGDKALWFGTANENWGASVYAKDGDTWEPGEDYVETTVPSNSQDANAIANAIAKTVDEFVIKQAGGTRGGAKCARCGAMITGPKPKDGLCPGCRGAA